MKPQEIIFNGIIGKRNNVTIPNRILNKYFLKTQGTSVLLLEIKNMKFYSNVSYQNFSYSLYLPKLVTRSLNLNSGDKIKIKVIDILKKKLSRSDISKLSFELLRQESSIGTNSTKQTYSNFIRTIDDTKYVDMQKLLSSKIEANNHIVSFLAENVQNNDLLISYKLDNVKRKSRSVVIKRHILLYPFVQFLGFYIGDGTTTPSTGSVSFINTSRDVIKWNIDFLKTNFESSLKYHLVYGPIKPNKKVSEKIRKFWSEVEIKNFNWSINKGYKNPSKFGTMRVNTISMPLKLVILKSLEEISKQATKNATIAKFFLKGLAMSDMYPTTKNGILESISIAFKEGDKKSINLYRKIFGAYGVKVKNNSKRVENTTALSTYRMEDFIKILIDNIFEFHEVRKTKFIRGLLNMDLFSRYVERLKLFLDEPFTAEEFAKKSGLSDIPYEQLVRLIKLGFLNKMDTYPRLYFITTQGKELLNRLIDVN